MGNKKPTNWLGLAKRRVTFNPELSEAALSAVYSNFDKCYTGSSG